MRAMPRGISFSFAFNLDEVVFKPKKDIRIPIKFVCGKKQKVELLQLQELAGKKEISIAVKLDNNEICFVFDESLISKEKRF